MSAKAVKELKPLRTVTLSDSATGRTVEFPVYDGTLGPSVVDVRGLYKDSGVFTYDPGYMSTGSCQSGITFIDGE